MDYVLDGYCGVYCGACPVLLATKVEKLSEGQQCYGCKSEKPTGFCETCRIKACAVNQGFEFCIECGQLMTCDLMHRFIADQQYPYGQCVMKNLKMIQTTSLLNWLEMQDNRWRCGHCGDPYSWYQQTCSNCGSGVNSYLADL